MSRKAEKREDKGGQPDKGVEEKAEEPTVVVRREINDMSRAQQERFFDAVDRMIKNGEYLRIAGYHGRPGDSYCSHGVETFPGWHRIYLLEFENALRAADKKNGNDGNIGLPYWDWSKNPKVPQIVRQRQPEGNWPKGLFSEKLMREENIPRLRRNRDSQVTSQIKSYGVVSDARDCLLNAEHWAHASTAHQTSYPSIETAHNSMHVIVGGRGGPMASVSWAAFDICFWLHHNNIDRIYESYLAHEPDSMHEFENFQNNRSNDLYDQPLTPFKKKDGYSYMCADTFDIKALGFVYDRLEEEPAMQLRMPPTVALFPQVKVTELKGKCYGVYVFVVDQKKSKEFKEGFDLKSTIEAVEAMPEYAGSAGIFARGPRCGTCKKRRPFDLIVDITECLKRQSLSRYAVDLVVFCVDTTDVDPDADEFVGLESCVGMPTPIVTGPLFEDRESGLDEGHRKEQSSEETKALQRYLRRFGYYDDGTDDLIDGDFGPMTNTAVREYQEAAGLKVDGLVGPITKKKIMTGKRCENKDPFASNKVEDTESLESKEAIGDKKVITYSIGVEPGYLKRDDVIKCIGDAFTTWSNVCGLSFQLTSTSTGEDGDEKKSDESADIHVSWAMEAENPDNLNRFDGPGGVLGKGGKGYVVFDYAERWTCDGKGSDLNDTETWYKGQPIISLSYTATHEIGHALGLTHTVHANDFMGPFYNPSLESLSENDIQRIQAIHGSNEAAAASE